MTVVIAPKRTVTALKIPTTSDLYDGEIAINYTDGSIYQRVGSGIFKVGDKSEGTVTSVSAGNGMDFTNITGWGLVSLGTPGTLSGTTTNAVQANSHTHELSTNLSAWDGVTVSSKADSARTITAGNGLSGGGSLAANRTITLGTPGTLSGSTTNSVSTSSHTHSLDLASAYNWTGTHTFTNTVTSFVTPGTSLGSSRVDISSPGSVAGVVGVSPSGLRRDVRFTDTGLQIGVSTSGADQGVQHSLLGTGYSTTGTIDSVGDITSQGYISAPNGAFYDIQGNVRKLPFTTKNANYTFTTSDFNGAVEKSNNSSYTYTLPNIGSQSQAITIVNSGTAGNITIARGTGVALYRNGVNANITVGPGSMLTIYRSATSGRWIA